MKIALLFAGQGAQYEGMGKDLYENNPSAREIFDIAGNEIKKWCFNSSKDILRATHITQPTVYTVTMAAYAAFINEIKKVNLLNTYKTEDAKKKDKLSICALAGFSLGEYAALTAAGAISDFEQGLRLVTKRGEIMGSIKGGAMAAAMGKKEATIKCVEHSRADSILEAANFNSPSQTVVAGTQSAIDRFVENAHNFSIKPIKLSVGSAFHSPLMNDAAEEFRNFLENEDFGKLNIPTFSNVNANDISKLNPEELKDLMGVQINRPVRWEESIRNIKKFGIDVMIEIGPGKTLKGFLNKIDKEIHGFHIDNMETLEKTIGGLKSLC